jgi:hypothetical protein
MYILYIHAWTVSNIDNVNILCKYSLNIDWYWQKTDPTSRQRTDQSETALAKTSSNSKLQTRPLVRRGSTK